MVILYAQNISVGCLSHRGRIIIQRSDPISTGQIGTFRHKKCPCAQDLTLIRFKYLATANLHIWEFCINLHRIKASGAGCGWTINKEYTKPCCTDMTKNIE